MKTSCKIDWLVDGARFYSQVDVYVVLRLHLGLHLHAYEYHAENVYDLSSRTCDDRKTLSYFMTR